VDTITGVELCAIFTILQVADVWTTHKVLSAGGSELNPVMDWFFKRFGVLPSLIVIKVAVVVVFWVYMLDYPLLVSAVCIFYAFVIVNNLKHMKRR